MNAPSKVKRVKSVPRLFAVPDTPPEVPARDPVRGIIPISELEADLLVRVSNGPEFLDSLTIQLFVGNDFEDASYRRGDPIELKGFDLSDPDLKFDLYYKVSEFPPQGEDVTESLNYVLFDEDSGDFTPGVPINIRFDRKPAGGDELPPIAFTDDQLSGITNSDLDVNGDLNVLIDPYYLGEDGDVIEMWVGDAVDSGSYLTPPFTITNPKLQMQVKYTRAQLEAAGDGQDLYFGYKVTDFAGNESQISNLIRIPVFINLPELDAPVVPEAADGLVTYNDANPSVTVEIPHYDGAALDDGIVVIWAGARANRYRLTQEDIDRDPALPVASIEVPFALVAAGGNGTVVVSYEMDRANNPTTPSPGTDVPVNLTTPGGPDPDPDPETPEHGNVKAPLIKVATSPDNTITPDDFGQPGTATIFRVGNDLKPIWLVGDVIQMHWGTVSSPQIASVAVTAANEGANIPVPIPFDDVIEAEGVGPIPTYFTITRELPVPPPGSGTVPVTIKSAEQIVTVASSGALPGDGGQLRAAVFPEANARNIITKAVGSRGTTLRILLDGLTNIELASNPRVSYEFVGITSGDAGGPPTPPGSPIEDSRISGVDVPLTQADLDQGYFEVPLPYAKTYYICRNGAKVNYSLANEVGRNSDHVEAFVRFAMNEAGGTCLVPSLSSFSAMATRGIGLQGSAGKVMGAVCSPQSTDMTALPPIAFTEDQRSGISDEDLENGLLVADVNPYGGMEPGDILQPWVGLSNAEASGRYLDTTSSVDKPGSKTPISFARADLLAVGNQATLYFGYRVKSANGEPTALSALVPISVNLTE